MNEGRTLQGRGAPFYARARYDWSKPSLGAASRLWTGFAAVRRLALNQVPTVAIKVLENRNDAMSLMPWLLNEPHTGRDHARMIAIEIIRL